MRIAPKYATLPSENCGATVRFPGCGACSHKNLPHSLQGSHPRHCLCAGEMAWDFCLDFCTAFEPKGEGVWTVYRYALDHPANDQIVILLHAELPVFSKRYNLIKLAVPADIRFAFSFLSGKKCREPSDFFGNLLKLPFIACEIFFRSAVFGYCLTKGFPLCDFFTKPLLLCGSFILQCGGKMTFGQRN